MAVGKGFFDQYSVFCVFGSVVGCVVVPLITQSVESVIFSAIVISLTATHLTKRASKSDAHQVYNVKEVDKRCNRKTKERDVQNGQIKRKKILSQQIVLTRSLDSRKKRQINLEKLEQARQEETDRKIEERKEKKIKKKEERMKKKEQEKEDKEREDEKLKKLKEERLKENLKQQEKIVSQKQETHKPRIFKTSKKSENLLLKPLYQPVHPTILTVDALSRERTKSESSDTCSSPPPSVWKVPEYVEPKWNPGKDEKISKTFSTKLNNDTVCKKSKLTAPFNQLYNPVHSNQSFCKNHYMNQEKEFCLMEPTTASSYLLLKDMDKPDNRQHTNGDSYSSFSGLPDILSQLKQGQSEEVKVKSYSLFGSDQSDSSVFRSPLTGL